MKENPQNIILEMRSIDFNSRADETANKGSKCV
jgi:hypothetical protein